MRAILSHSRYPGGRYSVGIQQLYRKSIACLYFFPSEVNDEPQICSYIYFFFGRDLYECVITLMEYAGTCPTNQSFFLSTHSEVYKEIFLIKLINEYFILN